MIRKALRRREPNPGGMILVSILLHLTAALVLNHIAASKPLLHEATAYYVDIVSLPTLEPAPPNASSAPLAAATVATTPNSLPTPPPPAKPAMVLPEKKAAAPAQQKPVSKVQESGNEEAREFAQKMSRIEHNADARHQAEALARLQQKAAARQSGGGPANSGKEQGVDYGAYIQSRLKDALATTMVYRSKAPEALVHLYLDKNGKVVRYVMERPSGDKLFNDSVIRTIEKAKVNFPPTPNGAAYDKLFVFSPIEVVQ